MKAIWTRRWTQIRYLGMSPILGLADCFRFSD